MLFRTKHMLALQGMTPDALAKAARIPIADARAIVSAVHRERTAEPMPTVRRSSREAAFRLGSEPRLDVISIQKSTLDPFVKLLLSASDGVRFETVRIPLEKPGRFSVCVSSQVGCALACAFCATGRMGLTRNLETWEICEQVRCVRRTLEAGQRVHGVVFQGMGEPLANLDRVLEAIAVLTDPSAQALDSRKITVCTSGIPSGIRRLAHEAPKVRLGLSIGSGVEATRRSIMPIGNSHPWSEIASASEEHAKITGLAPMWAVTLLDGVNDGPEHARALGQRARTFSDSTGVRPRITIVPYNTVGSGDPFKRSTREAAFRDELAQSGFFSHKRYSGGADVQAACGQLVASETIF